VYYSFSFCRKTNILKYTSYLFLLLIFQISSGFGNARIINASSPVVLDVRCIYSATLMLDQAGNATQPLLIDSLVLVPDYHISKTYTHESNSALYTNHFLVLISRGIVISVIIFCFLLWRFIFLKRLVQNCFLKNVYKQRVVIYKKTFVLPNLFL